MRVRLWHWQVKKIPLPMDPKEETKILREVTILSRSVEHAMTESKAAICDADFDPIIICFIRMSHPHIVRYHACWIETGPAASSVSGSELGSNFTDSDRNEPEQARGSYPKIRSRQISYTDKELVIQEEDSDSSSQDNEDEEDSTTINDFDLRLDDLDFLSYDTRDISLPSIRFADPDRSTSGLMNRFTEKKNEESDKSSSDEDQLQGLLKPPILRRTCKCFVSRYHDRPAFFAKF